MGEDRYLSRILENDNASYYDFEEKFSLHLHASDKVASYRVQGFSYADFPYEDVDVLRKKGISSAGDLKHAGYIYLFVKKGNISWFCARVLLSGCIKDNFALLSEHIPVKLYLYKSK